MIITWRSKVKERKRKRKREIKNHLQKSSLSRGKKSKQNEPFKKLKRHLKKRRVNMILNLISSLILFLYFFFFSNMINSNFFFCSAKCIWYKSCIAWDEIIKVTWFQRFRAWGSMKMFFLILLYMNFIQWKTIGDLLKWIKEKLFSNGHSPDWGWFTLCILEFFCQMQ